MYFNWSAFFKALKLSLFRGPFSLRRWAYVIGFTILFLIFLTLIALARALDHVFWPGLKAIEIQDPIFIIAPPRSGTSYLQKLLSQDERHVLYWKMYQTVFPAATIQKGFSFLLLVDRSLGRPTARLLGFLEKRFLGMWDGLHTMRMDQPEEDGAIYLYAFACEAIYMLFPFVYELWELGFPDHLPVSERKRLTQYYRSCLQRHVLIQGQKPRILVKSTNSSGAVEALLQEFPEARFISIFRSPEESIASSISLLMPAIRSHSPEIPLNGNVAKDYATLSIEWYRYLHAFWKKLDPKRFYVVDYRELTRSPAAVIEAIYAHFGWPLENTFRQTLLTLERENKAYRSQHHYTLESFGLSREWIRSELAPLIKAYGLSDEFRQGSAFGGATANS